MSIDRDEYISTSSNEEMFDAMLRRIHRSLLKCNGFKKDRYHFRITGEQGGAHFGYLIGFQKSAYISRAELRFAINIARMQSNEPIHEKFKDYDCDAPRDRERLAVLSPKYGYDKWWSITSETNMDLIEREMLDLLQNVAFPWFGLTT